MCRQQMINRCPDHRFIEVGILNGYRWIISTRGYANIVKSPLDIVYGAVYAITNSDEQKLDKYEGVNSGSYRKELITVEINFVPSNCLVYIDPLTTDGFPKTEYIDRINRGIADVNLPSDYVERYIRKYLPLSSL